MLGFAVQEGKRPVDEWVSGGRQPARFYVVRNSRERGHMMTAVERQVSPAQQHGGNLALTPSQLDMWRTRGLLQAPHPPLQDVLPKAGGVPQ